MKKNLLILLLGLLLITGCEKKEENGTGAEPAPKDSVLVSQETTWERVEISILDDLSSTGYLNSYMFKSPIITDNMSNDVAVYKTDKYILAVAISEDKAYENAKTFLKDYYKIENIPSSETGNVTYNSKSYKYYGKKNLDPSFSEYVICINLGSLKDDEVKNFVDEVINSTRMNIN